MAVDRTKRVTIFYDGRPITAYDGQSVAGALYAAGIRTFSRSFKYHRPRGLLCVAGRCPNCMMNVDGEANVRVCTLPVRDGIEVKTQNAWPSVDRDVFGVFDKMDRLLPVGFYYKTFIRPRSMWPVYERVLRNIAGLGKLGDAEPDHHFERQYKYVDVAVIGGGPAGMAAALAAAESGLDVALVDEQQALGGHLRAQDRAYDAPDVYKGMAGSDVAERMAAELATKPNVDALTGAVAFGFYEGNLIGVHRDNRLIELRTRRTVFATGRFERPLVFENNDLPGVMLGTGAMRLLKLEGVRPGQRAVVVSASDEGLAVAAELNGAGVSVAAVADLRSSVPPTLPIVQKLQEAGIPLFAGHAVQAAKGTTHVAGAVIIRLDAQGEPVANSEITLACDLIVLSAGFEVASGPLKQAGCTFEYDANLDQFTLKDLGADVFAAGEVTGALALPAILNQGRLAGLSAAAELKPDDQDLAGARDALRREVEKSPNGAVQRPQGRNVPSISASGNGTGGKKFVCVCEDVTEKDVCMAIREGFDDVETLKRYTTFTMGPCQGKMCALATIKLTARETGGSVDLVGTTTARPPYQPVPLGVLAGPHHEPTKLTPMHHRHVALGAQLMDTGEWKRPRIYTSGPDEVRGVRERVGLIDVSTLGKLDVEGKDAVQLLEKVYTNKVGDLRIGRVRYGVICDDAGIILDDGTIARISDDHFFITTTSTGATAMEEWFTWWAAGTGICVHVTNVTDGFASVNLAGPRARDVLRKLTTQDLATKAFPYLAARAMEVAGIPTYTLRIGFVGELGYEMHCPAEYGEQLWDALMEAGREFGIVPFGVEAQRVLRLEKGHIIVTQDTDALSNPLEADMPWVVKFDKDDFVGKRMLEREKNAGPKNKLIGYEMVDPSIVPDEGSQIVVAGRPAGRVTSARFSPTLQKSIGMAWVPIDYAATGSLFMVRLHERDVPARVVPMPFYDPEGTRMRAGDEPASPDGAAEPEAKPLVRRSALHHVLVNRRATLAEVDGWQQAERFGDAAAEVEKARQGVGIADVSAVGKIDLKGTDLEGFLGRLTDGYPPTQPGSIGRAQVNGQGCSIIRIAPDHALLLTGPDAVDMIAATIAGETSGECVHLTNVTSVMANLRLVGPRARDLLSKVTSVDLRDRNLPDGAATSVGLARIPALIVRQDDRQETGGLLGYTIHFSRDYGEYVWSILLEAGREFDLVPIGRQALQTLGTEI